VSQVLHDEIDTLRLELGQIEERNQALSKDNAVLLQRWLDAKQNEANLMNEANQFHSEMKARRDTLQGPNGHQSSHDGLSPQSGNGEALGNPPPTRAMDGKAFLQAGKQTLNPNG
jgi:autophagy-related protein 16-1